VVPYAIQCLRNNTWMTLQTDQLLPGDIVSVTRRPSSQSHAAASANSQAPTQVETTIPADILLLSGTCIVNEAMLSGESTPLLKESIQLLDTRENLDVDGAHKGAVLFSGTKVLQASAGSSLDNGSGSSKAVETPDAGCLGIVLRTGFGTAQGQLVRTMIFSTERVSANNMESFLFIGFLLIFAIAASWYVWVKGMFFCRVFVGLRDFSFLRIYASVC
jgi:cation-transporting ATPase 13A1